MSDDEATALDHLTRRIADALERHLPDYGFQPFRYPSGENKSVYYDGPGEVTVYDAEKRLWTVRVARWIPGANR